MDARSFSTFIKETLIAEARKYEGNLLSVNYTDIAEAKRIGGIRDTLIGLVQSLDKLLEEFYTKGGNTVVMDKD